MINKTNTRVLNLSTENETPYNIGEYYNTSGWVDFGVRNDYPEYLRNLYLNSPTHQAVVDSTINLATGEGVVVENPELNPISNKWLNENFPPETIKNIISDLIIYGMAHCTVHSGNIVKHSEAIKYRFNKKDDSGEITSVWFSNDWDKYMGKNNRPVNLPIYTEGTNEPISVLCITLDKKSYDYYAPVSYAGAINYINLEAKISEFHLSNIKNGLFPSFVINFVGAEFSDEQMDQIERDVNRKFGSGGGNSGRAIIGFINNKDDATTITPVDQPNLSEQYQFLTRECSEKILVGHGLTSPLLAGIRSEGGGLGSNSEELQQAYYLYYESRLKHIQNYVIQMIRKIMDGNLLYAPIKFKTYNPFNVKDTTEQLSKIDYVSEVGSQTQLSEIDAIAVKPYAKKLSEKIFNGVLNDKNLYKFVKSSHKNNIIIKKFESLDKKGYLFKASELIKNTNDYYFMEFSFLKNNTEKIIQKNNEKHTTNQFR